MINTTYQKQKKRMSRINFQKSLDTQLERFPCLKGISTTRTQKNTRGEGMEPLAL